MLKQNGKRVTRHTILEQFLEDDVTFFEIEKNGMVVYCGLLKTDSNNPNSTFLFKVYSDNTFYPIKVEVDKEKSVETFLSNTHIFNNTPFDVAPVAQRLYKLFKNQNKGI